MSMCVKSDSFVAMWGYVKILTDLLECKCFCHQCTSWHHLHTEHTWCVCHCWHACHFCATESQAGGNQIPSSWVTLTDLHWLHEFHLLEDICLVVLTNKQTNRWGFCKIFGSDSRCFQTFQTNTVLSSPGSNSQRTISWATQTWKWRQYIKLLHHPMIQSHTPEDLIHKHCIQLGVKPTGSKVLITSITLKNFTVEISVILWNFGVWHLVRAQVNI